MGKGSWAAILPLRGAGLEPWLGGVSGSPAPGVQRQSVPQHTRGTRLRPACPCWGGMRLYGEGLEVFLKEPEGPDWKQNGLSYWNVRLFSHLGKKLKRSLHSPKSHRRLPQPQVVSVPAPPLLLPTQSLLVTSDQHRPASQTTDQTCLLFWL